MDFPVRTGAPTTQKTACSILPVFEGSTVTGPAKQVDSASRGIIRRMLRSGDFAGKLGTTLLVPRTTGTAAERWLLVGCGPRGEFSAKRLGRAMTAAVQALKNTGIKEAASYLAYEPPAGVDDYYAARLSVEAARTALYRFDELKSKPEPNSKLTRLAIGIADKEQTAETRRGVAHGQAIGNGMDLARDLANRPANVCTPSHLADTARDLAKAHASLEAEILDEKEMKKLGMGALLSVTAGAGEPARLIVLHYRGAAKDDAPIVLCGKGITFDTGGISIKPAPKMDEMKFDMCGAAGVIGTMRALAELEPEINVTAIVPACENMPDSRATRPGDIVTSMSGQTIEILNTDAEGRLVLCDAMTYAKRFNPRCIIDVATLTGACIIALGNVHSGLFSKDEALTDALLAAAKRSLDSAWPLPVDDEYFESLKSNFADFANSGAREAGASIAAQFLSKFVDGVPWAHLDIAGVSWRAQAEKGATGRPVPLLTDYILNATEAA